MIGIVPRGFITVSWCISELTVDVWMCHQFKKTAEELSDALASKEEIAQRCHELDMQVSISKKTAESTPPSTPALRFGATTN